MIPILRRILGQGQDPTDVLKLELAKGKEGVNWVGQAISAKADPSELTDEERAQALFDSGEAAIDFANTWGPAGFQKGGPIPQSAALTFRAYDPDTATLTVATQNGVDHSLTAYWVINLQPNRNFDGKQEVDWSTSISPARGPGMRPALMARVYGDTYGIPGLPRDDRMGNAQTAMPYCYAAGSFVGLDDVLALPETETVTRYFVIDAAHLPEAP